MEAGEGEFMTVARLMEMTNLFTVGGGTEHALMVKEHSLADKPPLAPDAAVASGCQGHPARFHGRLRTRPLVERHDLLQGCKHLPPEAGSHLPGDQ